MSSENSIWLGETGYFQLCRLGASVWLLRRIWIGLNPCLLAKCITSGRTLLVSACWRVRVEPEFRARIVHRRKRRLQPLPDKAHLEGQRLEPSLTLKAHLEGQRLEPSLTLKAHLEGQRLEPSLTLKGAPRRAGA